MVTTGPIEQFTELCGGCTVNENVGGYYLSQSNEVIDNRVSIVYSDFPMNWDQPAERTDVLNYCSTLQGFLLENLWEERDSDCGFSGFAYEALRYGRGDSGLTLETVNDGCVVCIDSILDSCEVH
jgi:hypothetical protein